LVGKVISTQNMENESNISFDLTEIESGIYFVKTIGANINETKKIIVN